MHLMFQCSVSHLHLCVEAVQARAGGALMVPSQKRHVLWHGQFPGRQQDQDLKAPGSSIHKITCSSSRPWAILPDTCS